MTDRSVCYDQLFALHESSVPRLDLHLVDNCKHPVQWDAMAQCHRLAGEFLVHGAGAGGSFLSHRLRREK